ncbi:MAG: D-2-hydroxyacid dehydrogenase family protein [Gemmatimonadales bacterium]
MHIVIPDDYQNAVRGLECFHKLDGHRVTVFRDTVRDLDSLARRFEDADALVLIRERTSITAELLDRLPKLRLISQTGRGTGHIDLAACRRHGVTVAAGSGSPHAPAELTWALVLAAMRHVPREVERMRRGEWQGSLGTGLRGRMLGIWGYGKIGTLVAGYGRQFGMTVLVWGREGSRARGAADGHLVVSGPDQLFEESDVLSLHLRLTADTRGVVSGQALGRMKPTSLLVNTSRAELIEHGALERALGLGRPGMAAVDVYQEEPVVGGAHPLLKLDNALCTPHLGYVEQDTYELYFGQAFDRVLAFASGRLAPGGPGSGS